jgi:hypothetical protein
MSEDYTKVGEWSESLAFAEDSIFLSIYDLA